LKLTINSYFDNEDGKFIAEKFFIDGEECSEEEFDDLMDEFDKVNDEIENEFDPCENCECRCCEEGIDYEDLLDIFVGRILDAENCPGCIYNILDEFACIFLPDDEDELD